MCNFPFLFCFCCSQDLSSLKDALDKYKDWLPSLEGTREAQLIEDTILDFEEDEMDRFTDHVFKFDEICKLDNWSTKILLEIKNALKNGPQGGVDTDDLT